MADNCDCHCCTILRKRRYKLTEEQEEAMTQDELDKHYNRGVYATWDILDCPDCRFTLQNRFECDEYARLYAKDIITTPSGDRYRMRDIKPLILHLAGFVEIKNLKEYLANKSREEDPDPKEVLLARKKILSRLPKVK